MRTGSGTQGTARIDGHAVALSLRRELTRKGLHVVSTAVPIAYAAGVSRVIILWTLVTALAIAVAVEVGRACSERARTLFHSGVGPLLREHEHNGVSGATWLIAALVLAAALFPRDVAIAAMCSVSLGDAAAAVIGRSLSRSGIAHRKTVSGSVACFAASAIAAYVIADFSLQEALITGVLASFAERMQRPMDDNLRITIAVGCGILLWRMGFS